ncbi:hypothetical protein JZ751_029784 [Albula glossodonta]|uniref:Uncharacterized protein n=1 Tax=Albula glossodonta TaxID=121402 RepID=A0A8T2NBA7_9TELE|nr:hypothetical protein JZ751_029784 [Albula glossodonta]
MPSVQEPVSDSQSVLTYLLVSDTKSDHEVLGDTHPCYSSPPAKYSCGWRTIQLSISKALHGMGPFITKRQPPLWPALKPQQPNKQALPACRQQLPDQSRGGNGVGEECQPMTFSHPPPPPLTLICDMCLLVAMAKAGLVNPLSSPCRPAGGLPPSLSLHCHGIPPEYCNHTENDTT